MPPKKIMRYHPSYLKYGFIAIQLNGEEKPQCVLCSEVLASSSLKPSKLKRHLEAKHSSLKTRDVNFFEHHAEQLCSTRIDDTEIWSQSVKAGLRASYEVSRKIAAAKQPHNIGEELILPCCKDIISYVLGSSELDKLSHVCLSKDTVRRRIAEMSDNILSQVVSKIQNSMFTFFAIQLDETTDVTNLAQLCVYVRYVYDKHLEDEFLFCETLSTRATAKEIFDKVDRFFEAHDIKWEHLIGVCTDGSPALLGCHSGFQTLVKQKSPNIIGTHCTIHCQALMVKTMPNEWKNVLDHVITAVNFIKSNAINSRLFSELCKESDSEFETLLLHSHERWLSTGKVLKRVFILRKEIQHFLKDTKPELHEKFSNVRFLISLSFLVDIFESVNSINLALQGKDITVLHCHEKLTAFQMKIELWILKLENKNFAPFPQLNTYIDENDLEVDGDILEVMKQHLFVLSKEISYYFPDLQEFDKHYHFITNPFELAISDLPSEDSFIQEQLIDLINDGSAKHVFHQTCCSDFWIEMAQSYPDVAKIALRVLIPFVTTYECESAVSTLLTIKTKSRNRLNVTNDVRVALAKTKPNIEEPVQAKIMLPSQ